MIPVEPTADTPIPFDISDDQPLTHKDAVATAVNTADLISQLGGGLDFSNDDLDKAQKLVLGQEKTNTPKHVTFRGEAAAAHSLIREYDFTAFADALQARNFITNKLVRLADCGDPKLELKALELLGKISDVGLFTDKTEVTIKNVELGDIENQIRTKLFKILGNSMAVDTSFEVVDTEEIPVNPDPTETKE